MQTTRLRSYILPRSMEITTLGIFLIAFAAFTIGVSKSGVPGLTILLPPVLALVMPVRESIGALLPLLSMGDIIAVLYWRRIASPGELLKIVPSAFVGVVLGYFLMRIIPNAVFEPLLGWMIVALIAFDLFRRYSKLDLRLESRGFAMGIGVLAGMCTMMANVATPVMAVYLLSMKLKKEDFLGTYAWFFLIMNTIKIPFSAALGLVTWKYFKLDFMMLPVLVAGGLAGGLVVKKLPQRAFEIIIQILAAGASVKLIL